MENTWKIIIIQKHPHLFSIITFFLLWKIHLFECLLLQSMKLYTSCMCGIIYIPVLFHKISEVAYKKNNKTA